MLPGPARREERAREGAKLQSPGSQPEALADGEREERMPLRSRLTSPPHTPGAVEFCVLEKPNLERPKDRTPTT